MAVNVWQGVQQGQQLVDNLFRQRDQMQAGRALATGDYGSAMRALGAGGDIQGVRQIQADQVQAQQRQRATQEEDTGRQIAFTRQATAALRKAMTEGGDALATYDSMAPAFQQIGATPEQLQQYRQALAADPEGFLTNIERATAEAERKLSFQKAGNNVLVFEEGNPDPLRTFSAPREDYTLGQTRFSGLTNEPVAQAARPSEFIQVDPYKNLTEIPGTPPVGGGGRMTRGLRNNNPGNIEDGNFAKSLPGYKGSDGRFAIFETPEDGVNAGVKLLESYAGRGVVTPAQVINRWAPPSDNNPTQAYAKYVADRLGIGVNDPIPAERGLRRFRRSTSLKTEIEVRHKEGALRHAWLPRRAHRLRRPSSRLRKNPNSASRRRVFSSETEAGRSRRFQELSRVRKSSPKDSVRLRRSHTAPSRPATNCASSKAKALEPRRLKSCWATEP